MCHYCVVLWHICVVRQQHCEIPTVHLVSVVMCQLCDVPVLQQIVVCPVSRVSWLIVEGLKTKVAHTGSDSDTNDK
uniref:Uncharacterized protein n=1 Tax=Octopus bimaculoides TaxID=37653 RepID=A0A0L8GT91_OCTBM